MVFYKFVTMMSEPESQPKGTKKQLTLWKLLLFVRFCSRLLAFHSIFDLCFSCHAIGARIAHKIAFTSEEEFKGLAGQKHFRRPKGSSHRSSTLFGPLVSGAVDVYIFRMLVKHSASLLVFLLSAHSGLSNYSSSSSSTVSTIIFSAEIEKVYEQF